MADILFWIALFLLTVTIHEVSHGYVAYWLGDKTAYLAGRLTLNPLKHIDFFWTILFPAILLFATAGRFSLGMAKPVPVNFANLQRPKRDMVLVALAGPLSNLILAWILANLYHITHFGFFLLGVYFNLGLGFFNLIPIPPLDGSRIVFGFLPRRFERIFEEIEAVGFWIILLLYITGVLFAAIMPGINLFARLLAVPPIGF